MARADELTAVAAVQPTRKDNTGILRLIGSDDEVRYTPGKHGPQVAEYGLYEIRYVPSPDYEGWVFLRKAVRTIPDSPRVLESYVRAVLTENQAEQLLDLIDLDRELEEILDDFGNRNLLMKMKGIGSKKVDKLMKKLGSFDRVELRVRQAMLAHGFVLDTTTNRGRFALQYFRKFPPQIDSLLENPYLLLTIGDRRDDKSRRVISELKQKSTKALRLARYTLAEIDKAALEGDQRWMYHAFRVKAHLHHAVEDSMRDGDSVILFSQLLDTLRRMGLTHITDDRAVAPIPLMAERVELLIRETPDLKIVTMLDGYGNELVGVTFRDFLDWYKTITSTVARLTKAGEETFDAVRADAMMRHAMQHVSIELTREQKLALHHAFGSRFSAITGGPGTGKTTTATVFLNGIQTATRPYYRMLIPGQYSKDPETAFHIYILAPTGVATQRVRLSLDLRDPSTGESIIPEAINAWQTPDTFFLNDGRTHIGTLHSFLGYVGDSTYMLPNPHPCILFVDEVSMIDEEPMYHLMRYAEKCLDASIPISILFSGDEDQLPPVGTGFPFRDLLGAGFGAHIPITRLTVPKRQTGRSMIVEASQRIKHAQLPPSADEWHAQGVPHADKDFLWVVPKDVRHTYDAIQMLRDYTTYLKGRARVSEEDVQIIVPLRNQSRIEPEALFVDQLNTSLQDFYAQRHGRQVMEIPTAVPDYPDSKHTYHLAVGDRVIHTGANGYHVEEHEPIMRGSIGVVTAIVPDAEGEDPTVSVQYPWMDCLVHYRTAEERYGLRLSYAITGHSAQGSEFDYILLVVPFRGGPTLVDRSWIYTAVTRAKKHLCLVASPSRIAKAVAHSNGLNRHTLLSRLLIGNQ